MEQHAIDQTEILVAESSVASESEGYPDIRQSILLLLRLILITLPVAIAFDIIEMAVGEQIAGSSLYFLTSNIIAYTVPFLLVIRFAFRKRREGIGGSLRKIAQKRIPVQEQSFLVLLTILLIPAIHPVQKLIPKIDWLDELLFTVFGQMIQPHILSFVAIAIMPAILEELLMRGIILDGLLRHHDPRKAILVSAFLFGLIHLNPIQFVYGFLSGLFLGWVYWRTRSLLACMVIHGVNNAFSFFGALAFGIETDMSRLLDSPIYISLVIGSALLFVMGVRWLSRSWKRRLPGELPDVNS